MKYNGKEMDFSQLDQFNKGEFKWQKEGLRIFKERDNNKWEICDWLIAGEQMGIIKHGIKSEFLEYISNKFGIKVSTLYHMKMIAKRLCIRIQELSYSHHVAVYKLPDEDQINLLNRAKMHKWSVRTLEKKVKDHKRNKSAKLQRDRDNEIDNHKNKNLNGRKKNIDIDSLPEEEDYLKNSVFVIKVKEYGESYTYKNKEEGVTFKGIKDVLEYIIKLTPGEEDITALLIKEIANEIVVEYCNYSEELESIINNHKVPN